MAATKDDVAQLTIAEAKKRKYGRDDCLAIMSTFYQESGWNETIWDPSQTTYGVAQQDGSYPNRFNGAAAQISAFFDRLDVQRKKPGASADIWLNICWLQQAPNWPSAQYWYDNGRRAYLDEIKSRIGTVRPYLDKYWADGSAPADNRPDFNEFPLWSPSNSSRGGTNVDSFFIHTQEGGGGDSAAEDLAKYLGNPFNQVSYHYTISQASDGGVTVVDVVDTDYASWSVLSANSRSINLCFAGSKASWSRDQWMKQSKAIDVAAYLVVQDCKKYGIPFNVVAPPYTGRIPGISDHRYVTQVLKDGTHTDVGDQFPWDYFTARINFYADIKAPVEPSEPTEPQPKVYPRDFTDRELLEEIWTQLRGPGGKGWPQLGQNSRGQNLSLVDGVAKLLGDK
ncbi:N-acetylmuramoyl-L-alanine amidase [Mycobacteroides abscessus]|uniref:peptidoglycan recognition protein family protein n=1 Tax=Mycobacteroides abscessus TaxID=36809 RepID=UPI00030366BD|nr:N-acetylmuramoyl-L-alanine amidase [Mycobacteroides abscessus]